MPAGRQSKALRPDQIALLLRFKRAPHDGARNGYSLPQLRSAMAAPFGYKTLGKALEGLPVWVNSHAYITQWIERFLLAKPVRDGKAAASGERNEEPLEVAAASVEGETDAEKTPGTARTIRRTIRGSE